MDFDALNDRGFVTLPGMIPQDMLAMFEDTMTRMGISGLKRKGLPVTDQEPMADLLKTGGDYRARLFLNLKNMKIVQELGMAVSKRLEAEGFLDWSGLEVPLVYPTLRADPPREMKYLLPYHQDYATQCARAWRVWVPLRDANPDAGTMKIVPGSHKLGLVEHDTSDPAHPVVPESAVAGLDPVVIDVKAGDGVLFDPLLVHASVPATQPRMKYVLLVQVQDLTTLADEDDPSDPLAARLAMSRTRDAVRN
ncbi:MAG: phytanoyl-CoA dioxygenase family protein [Alphaproteobacteria bacterium]|nr:phytanoyl-CoA dioxygenase family protein [Alphaproteobacteria bacterium]